MTRCSKMVPRSETDRRSADDAPRGSCHCSEQFERCEPLNYSTVLPKPTQTILQIPLCQHLSKGPTKAKLVKVDKEKITSIIGYKRLRTCHGHRTNKLCSEPNYGPEWSSFTFNPLANFCMSVFNAAALQNNSRRFWSLPNRTNRFFWFSTGQLRLCTKSGDNFWQTILKNFEIIFQMYFQSSKIRLRYFELRYSALAILRLRLWFFMSSMIFHRHPLMTPHKTPVPSTTISSNQKSSAKRRCNSHRDGDLYEINYEKNGKTDTNTPDPHGEKTQNEEIKNLGQTTLSSQHSSTRSLNSLRLLFPIWLEKRMCNQVKWPHNRNPGKHLERSPSDEPKEEPCKKDRSDKILAGKWTEINSSW